MAETSSVVVGVDHTPAGLAALRWAMKYAESHRHSLLAVRAFELPTRPDVVLEADLDQARADARQRTQSWVIDAIAGEDRDVPVTITIADGRADAVLGRFSRSGCRLLVVGTPSETRPPESSC